MYDLQVTKAVSKIYQYNSRTHQLGMRTLVNLVFTIICMDAFLSNSISKIVVPLILENIKELIFEKRNR